MKPAKYDMTIYQGSKFSKRFKWSGANNLPINLSSCTARMQARPGHGRSPIYLELTTENGGIVLGGDDGTIELKASHEQTAELDFNKASYDLEIISGSGEPIRLLEGSLTLSKEITR